ncbi:MAG: hypothetical protein FJ095_09245, partial [Deltaproteobacteria bacterium]|nr:hypothetical protein [Deltaproteobacteria bacterium]
MTTASQQQAARPRAQAADEDVLASAVMVELHRLVKQATLYTSENEAQRQQLLAAQQAIMDFGRRTGANPRIYFADKSVYIGRRLFRAGRQVYESALEVAEILARFGIDEIAIGYDVPVEELKTFQTTLGLALRNAGPPPQSVRYARLRLRKGRPLKARRMNEDLSPQEVLVRSYCLAVVAVRRFLESIQRGKTDSINAVQRVVEQLVDVTHEMTSKQSPAFLAGVVLYNVRGESAGRAVNAAMLTLAMTRQLSDQLATLSRVAMASLLYDVGLPRVAGTGPEGEDRVGAMLPRIGIEQERELPAATAVVVTSLNGCSESGMMHTALVYEALSLNMRDNARAAYAGVHSVSLEARIVATARRFTELLADPDEERTAEQAMMHLLREGRDEADKTTARMLMAALGMYPTGTTVELSNGQVAMVLQTPNDPRRFGFPLVQPVLDASGGTLDGAPPLDLDGAAEQGVYISRVMALGDGSTEPRGGRRATATGAVAAAVATAQAAGPLNQGARRITVPVTPDAPDIGDSATDSRPPGFIALEQEALAQADTPQPTPSPQLTPRPIALGRIELTPPPQRSPVAAPVPQFSPTPRFTESTSNQRRQEFADALSTKPDDSDALAIDLPPDDGLLGAFGAGLVAQQSDDGSTIVFDPSLGPGPGAMLTPVPARGVTVATKLEEPFEVALDAALDAAFEPGKSLSDLAMTNELYSPTRDDRALDLATTGEISIDDGPPAIPPPAGLPRGMLGASDVSESDAYPDAAAERRIAERAQPAFEWFEERAEGLAPTAEGLLRKTPLTNLLVYLLDQQLSGTVVLTSAAMDAIHAFTVEEGRPVNVRTFGDVAPLDKVLLTLGVIEADGLLASHAAISRSGELHGAYLIRTGMVDEGMIEIALKMQAQQKLEHLLALPEDTTYMFFKDHDLLAGYGGREPIGVDPLALITIGVRHRKRDPLIDQTLARLGQLALTIHPLAAIGRLGFDHREAAVVDALLEEPRSLQALAAAGVTTVEVLKRAVYVLTITRSLQLGTNAKPPVGYVDAAPPSVADLAPPVFATMAPPASFDPSRLPSPASVPQPQAPLAAAPATPSFAPPEPMPQPESGASIATAATRIITSHVGLAATPAPSEVEEHAEDSLDDSAGTVV